MYGLTECMRVSYLPPDQLDERPTSVGDRDPRHRVPGSRTTTGSVLDAGEVGELMVRGAHVMQGYWHDPEPPIDGCGAALAPAERVLATGDLFRRDDEGFLYFVGRRDDLIKSRGEKVSPREIEEVLHAAPGVQEAAVVGVPDRLLGQAVHAHVAAHEGFELDPMALQRLCAEQLEDYMVPQHVESTTSYRATTTARSTDCCWRRADRSRPGGPDRANE